MTKRVAISFRVKPDGRPDIACLGYGAVGNRPRRIPRGWEWKAVVRRATTRAVSAMTFEGVIA